MKQITFDELRGSKYIWIPSEHSCGYDRCLLDWSGDVVKQEQEWIDHANIEGFLKEQEYFYITLQDAVHNENKHSLFDGFQTNEIVIVRLRPEEVSDHDDERLQIMDGKKVKLIHYIEDEGMYITDYFVSEMMEECSDWTHYGFMKVTKKDIAKIEEVK